MGGARGLVVISLGTVGQAPRRWILTRVKTTLIIVHLPVWLWCFSESQLLTIGLVRCIVRTPVCERMACCSPIVRSWQPSYSGWWPIGFSAKAWHFHLIIAERVRASRGPRGAVRRSPAYSVVGLCMKE